MQELQSLVQEAGNPFLAFRPKPMKTAIKPNVRQMSDAPT
jgi:hypothetical protein